MITDGSANVLSNNLYEAFGVLMYTSGSAATQWRFQGRFVEEEGLVASAGGGGDVLVGRGIAVLRAARLRHGPVGEPRQRCFHECDKRYKDAEKDCVEAFAECLAEAFPPIGWILCEYSAFLCFENARNDLHCCYMTCIGLL
ncbi:MAG: hypothetical protein KGJ62_12955 [Armatimonadetes bacterium]|nr:hypothetical protein [Armatimonadota bacterium]MDE2208018.1 hypothetical protein [Armatimonadota bacterium]